MKPDFINTKNIEIHLPDGRVRPILDVIEDCQYTLDFNLSYFLDIIKVFIDLNSSHKSFCFLLTRRVDELPDYDASKLKRLIVFLLGDEWCRMPSYATKVLTVFKCYGLNPTLELHQSNFYLNALILLQYIRVAFKDTKRWRKKHNIFSIPLGYFRQSDLPIKPILERDIDVSFTGSIKNSPSKGLLSIKDLLKSPKTVSRKSMVSSVEKWENPKNYNIDVKLTTHFPHANKVPDVLDYSERLMNTKICLSPRGTSLETFRYFESLRYGCVLIAEPVPKYWFYEDSPAIYLNNWNRLPVVIENLLADPNRLVELHEQALDWWQSRCSPAAVSARMYQYLNSDQRFSITS